MDEYNNDGHMLINLIRPSSATSDVTVAVTTPAFLGTVVSESVTLTGEAPAASVTVPVDLRLSGTEKVGKGILVSAQGDVTMAFGVNYEDGSCDGFLSLPTSVLGTSYIPITYWPPYYAAQVKGV